MRRARELLTRLREADAPGLLDVLERDVALLHRSKPLVVLVTRLADDDPDLERAILRIGAMGRVHGRSVVPGLLLDLEPRLPGGESPGSRIAQRALEEDRLAARAKARAAGVRVATWRPGHEPFEAALLRGRIA